MKRLSTVFALAGATVAVATIAPQVQARSSEALAIAEKACHDQGIKPHSTAFEKCVERVADAYDRTGQMPKVTWPTASIGQDGFQAISQA
ncbi:hypothetical protein [Reyranella sp.]|uniref:hypothetical protein n=1 Tax=Reyranella sp. TaxID=1929291 RepID=UPI003C7AFB5E